MATGGVDDKKLRPVWEPFPPDAAAISIGWACWAFAWVDVADDWRLV